MTKVEPQEAARLVEGSALFDPEWWGRQRSRAFTSRGAAAVDYVGQHLEATGVVATPHPLVDPAWIFPAAGWRKQAPDPVSAYLSGPIRWRRPTHPLLSLSRIVDTSPDAAADPAGPVDHWLRNAGPDDGVPMPDGATPATLGQLLGRLAEARVEPVPRAAAPPVVSRVSVVIATGAPLRICRWLLGVYREHPHLDVEVLVTADLDSIERRAALDVAAAVPRGRVVATPAGMSVAARMETGLTAASGGVTVLCAELPLAPYWSWLPELVAPVLDAAEGPVITQPLLLNPGRFVSSAGATFLDGYLGADSLLTGLAADEAVRLDGSPVPGPEGVAAIRTDVARDLTLDSRTATATPHVLPDLGLRARRRMGLLTYCVAGARLVRQQEPQRVDPVPLAAADLADAPVRESMAGWHRAGLDVETDGGGRVVGLAPRRQQSGSRRSTLRWTVDTPVTDGPWGLRWGDRYFARLLAQELEAAGHHVVVDPKESRGRPSRSLDDVVVHLRGRDPVVPVPDVVNILWVISHPTEVTRAEAAAFDVVAAGSPAWCRRVAHEWGVAAVPLDQATDPTSFTWRSAEPDSGPELLFVGNARGEARPAVAAALAAGLRPTIVGADWSGLVPPQLVVAQHVPHEELGPLYASAGVVLCDHWADMAEQGFVANRVYDALACGARVVSDLAPADPRLAGGVRTWTRPEDVRDLVDHRDRRFPPLAERRRLAEHVAEHDSFAARASTLVELARAVRGEPE